MRLQKAIKIVENHTQNYDFIDINLGCPVRKITSDGAGSALTKDVAKLEEIMTKIVACSSKPVTAKIRLGWDDKNINVFEVVKALQKAGVSMIGIHARTAKQMYDGKPDFEVIKNIRKSMSVPLAISGNIYTLDDAINAMEITGADFVMVARGGVGNPHLLEEINEYYKTGTRLEPTTLEKQIEYLHTFANMLIEEKGEERAMMILRGIAPKFFNGIAGCKKLKNALAQNLLKYSDLDVIINGNCFDNK